MESQESRVQQRSATRIVVAAWVVGVMFGSACLSGDGADDAPDASVDASQDSRADRGDVDGASTVDATTHDGATDAPEGGPTSDSEVDANDAGLDAVADAFVEAGPPGTLDTTFGDGGALVLIPGRATSIELRPSGEMVLAGRGVLADGGFARSVVQLTAGGAVDPSFADGGRYEAPIVDEDVVGARVLPNGETWVSTRTIGSASATAGQVTRLTQAGATIGSSAPIAPSFAYSSSLYGMTVVDSGVFFVGNTEPSPSADFEYLLSKRLHDGGLDPAFSLNGNNTRAFPGRWGRADSVVRQSTGNIVLAGGTSDTTMLGADVTVIRFLPNGVPDSTFGDAGNALQGLSQTYRALVAVAPDDSLFVGITQLTNDSTADVTVGTVARIGIWKTTPDGQVDTAFGNNGLALGPSVTVNTELGALRLLSDGKLVATGSILETGGDSGVQNQRMFVYRFNADGSLDSSFGTGGAFFSERGMPAMGNDIAIASDGKILIGGYVRTAEPQLRFAVWRVNP